MNKKNFLYAAYAAAFIGMCLAPAVMLAFDKNDGAAENRKLSEKPSIKTESGSLNSEFFSEFDTYFSEHFAFRKQLVTLNSTLRAELLADSADDDVIVGKDGWLFYGDTADDFMNVNTLSDRAINNIYRNLELLNEYCSEQGASFLFTVAPDKNSVYPEYMPYNYIESNNEGNYEKLLRIGESRYQAWYESMLSSIMSIATPTAKPCFVDLRETLRQAKLSSEYQLYHSTDTHWNNLGAMIAANELLSYITGDEQLYGTYGLTAKNDWSGDLAEMLYPTDVPADMQLYTDHDFAYEYVGRFKGFDDISIKTVCRDGSGGLLMYRDSFGEAILPFMAEAFGSAEFSRTVPYRVDAIANGEADNVILEIVERNLGNLQKYAPVMPAPECGKVLKNSPLSSDDRYTLCSDFTACYADANSYHHIYGVLGEEFFSSDASEIYVTVNGVTYAAFNAFEDKLLGMEGQSCDRGYSLYIPKTDANETIDMNNIIVTVVADNGDTAASGDISLAL